MSSPTTSHLIIVDHIPGRLSTTRKWLQKTLGERDAGSELVLTELVTNAIEHGAGGPVDVTVSTQTPEQVEIIVENATSEPPQLPPPTDTPPPTTNTRGRGLFIVRSIADVQSEYDAGRVQVKANLLRGQL